MSPFVSTTATVAQEAGPAAWAKLFTGASASRRRQGDPRNQRMTRARCIQYAATHIARRVPGSARVGCKEDSSAARYRIARVPGERQMSLPRHSVSSPPQGRRIETPRQLTAVTHQVNVVRRR